MSRRKRELILGGGVVVGGTWRVSLYTSLYPLQPFTAFLCSFLKSFGADSNWMDEESDFAKERELILGGEVVGGSGEGGGSVVNCVK